MSSSTSAARTKRTAAANPGIDPRGPRFTAALTALVLAAVLLIAPSVIATVLLFIQTVLFGLGAVRGVHRTPVARLFRTLVRPRLGAPDHLEDPAPPRFAQAVGLVFGLVGLIGFLLGADAVGLVATGFALAAALLNAVFGFCLGCEMYLLYRRLSRFRQAQPPMSSTPRPSSNPNLTSNGKATP